MTNLQTVHHLYQIYFDDWVRPFQERDWLAGKTAKEAFERLSEEEKAIFNAKLDPLDILSMADLRAQWRTISF